MKTVILGLGNTLLSDDGAGVLAARRLQTVIGKADDVDVVESGWGGFRIIDLLSGYDRAIIIDAIKTGLQPVGYIHRVDGRELVHSVRMVSFHDINFATALEFAREMGIPMPGNVTVYAIEVAETEVFSEFITPGVRRAIEECVRQVLDELSWHKPIEAEKNPERIWKTPEP